MELKGSKTEKNLLTAFVGESQARNRYTFASSVARKEGYQQISAIFDETAAQEKEHAKKLFKFLEGGEVEITASFPAGKIMDTLGNLEEAAEGEHFETTSMYPDYAQVAEEEGFAEIAAVLRRIAKVEERHRNRFLALKKNIEDGKVFKKDEPVRWICRNCGHIHEAAEAPAVCPLCNHPQAYFEIEAVNY